MCYTVPSRFWSGILLKHHTNGPGWCISMVRGLVHALRDLGLDSCSRACTWLAGSIPSPGQEMCRRQPINVFPLRWCFSLFLSPYLPPFYSLKLNGKNMLRWELTKNIVDLWREWRLPGWRDEGAFWSATDVLHFALYDNYTVVFI